MIKKGLNVALMGVLGLAIVGCDGQQKKTSETKESINITKNMEQAVYTKKFTNKDFYKDGKFQGDVALKAYEDMLSFYGIHLFIISLPAKKLRTARSCPSARLALSQLNIS